ncbi:MAG: secretin N-terminal domain-containing protein [Thermoanaerobaculia bacterium]
MKKTTFASSLLLALTLVSCTSYRAFERGKELEKKQKWDEAVIEYTRALEVDPENTHYKLGLQRARLESSREHFEKGKQLRASAIEANGSPDALRLHEMAAIELEATVRLDPTNQFAAVELGKTLKAIQEIRSAASPESLAERKKRALTKAQPPQLNPASDEPISLSFPRPTPVKDIYRALGNSFGINVMFDQGVKDEERITIELRDVTAQQALERVMQTASHFYKVLDEKTIIVVPDTPQTRRDYEDLVIRTFYLSNGDAEQVTNILRTMLEARSVFPLKALNAITIRDTADKVRIAEKIIEANDKAKAEVVVLVELLQVDAGKLREIGPKLSTNSILGAVSTIGADGKPTNQMTLDEIQGLTSDNWTLTVPSISYSLLKTTTDAELLAKPQLRISEGEKAVLHIGEKRPVPVSTLYNTVAGGTNNLGPVTSFQYQDVGIKISIEPRVHHNREVTLKLTVEVSSIAGSVPGSEGTPDQPIIATRTIESIIRLKDGETNFLAGLIRREEINSTSQIPFLSNFPILGRLFTRDSKQFASLDVVLTMTPHIIRIPDITDDDLAPMWVGTQGNMTFRGVSPRLESNIGVDPFGAPTQRPAPMQNEPGETEPEATPATPAPVPPPVAPGGAPSDPFRPKTNASLDGGTEASSAAFSAEYAVAAMPRIAMQPSVLPIRPGEEKLWPVVAMDVEQLNASEIRFHYDPMSLDVAEVVLGPALVFNAATPPAATINAAEGVIRLASTDGNPLQFRDGGQIAFIRVRGGVTGNTMMVLDPITLRRGDGQGVVAAIAGGRAVVE